jgi:predicted HAD superfamily Cof-like phosphohydrolase
MIPVTNFEKVIQFMNTFGQEVKSKPDWPDVTTKHLRVDLIEEELDELKEAIATDDLVAVADALTDILYVTYGAGAAFGMNLDVCFQEVHSSNMTKVGSDGKPVYREDGKVMKGPDYREPDLKTIIEHPTV